ncbi:MAG TPA: IS200/IS605 family transposase, partial [Cyanobacteria bacterium UBA8543]|nr:IS200/IS605 family transposase [Cyanobacteria bacterium UBA8543]
NHVHALIEYPPKLSISQIVNALKRVSSQGKQEESQSKIETLYMSCKYYSLY